MTESSFPRHNTLSCRFTLQQKNQFLITALSNVVGETGNYYAGYSRHQQL
jgi:hypothetical protein